MDAMYPPYEAAQGHGKQKEFSVKVSRGKP